MKAFVVFVGFFIFIYSSVGDVLHSKFYDVEFMEKGLPHILHQCQYLTNYETDFSRNVSLAICAEAQYLSDIQNLRNSLLLGALPKQSDLGKIDVFGLNSPFKYTQIFEDFIVENKPFKATMNISGINHTLAINKCLNAALKTPLNRLTMDYSLQACDFENDEYGETGFKLPSIIANNYLYRFNNTHGYTQDNIDSHVLDVNLTSHWPSALDLSPRSPTRLFSCPVSMHQILVSTDNKKIKIRLFASGLSNYFDPVLGSENMTLHYPVFKKSGFPKYDQTDDSVGSDSNRRSKFTLPKFMEETFSSEGEYMFIPHNYLTSIMLDEDVPLNRNSDQIQRNSRIIRLCFVDASNLNAFKSSLSISAKISQLDRNILAALKSPSFNLNMAMHVLEHDIATARNASALQLSSSNDVSWPQRLASVVGTSNTTGQPIDNGDADTVTQPQEPQVEVKSPTPRRRQRSRLNAALADKFDKQNQASPDHSFRGWQEEKKWEALIFSLTVPEPNQPVSTHQGRTNFTLEWEANFLPPAGDISPFSFNLTICPVEVVAAIPAFPLLQENEFESDGTVGSAVKSQCVLVPLTRMAPAASPKARQDGSAAAAGSDAGASSIDALSASQNQVGKSMVNVLMERIDSKRSLIVGSEVTMFSVVTTTNIQPSTSYRCRLESMYRLVASNPSEWSPVITTQPLTVPSRIPSLAYTNQVITDALRGGSGGALKLKKKLSGAQSVPQRRYAVEATSSKDSDPPAALARSPTSVHLSFLRPLDNGGAAILGYHVHARFVNDTDHRHPDWHPVHSHVGQPESKYAGASSDFETVIVDNLLPGAVYEFQLAAFNSIGTAPLSDVSNSVSTSLPAEHHDVAVRGYRRSTIAGEEKESDFLAVVDTSKHLLSSYSNFIATDPERVSKMASVTVPAWTCHWSHPMRAMGESVWVDPPLADLSLRNAEQIFGRIAWVERGHVALVYKIQRIQTAGALGVVVVDDGNCTAFDQECFPGSDKSKGDGFAALDMPGPWKAIRLPIIFILRADAISFATQLRDGGEPNIFARFAAPNPIQRGNDEL